MLLRLADKAVSLHYYIINLHGNYYTDEDTFKSTLSAYEKVYRDPILSIFTSGVARGLLGINADSQMIESFTRAVCAPLGRN